MLHKHAVGDALDDDHAVGGQWLEPVAHPHVQQQFVVFAQKITLRLHHLATGVHHHDLVGFELADDVRRMRGDDFLAVAAREQTREIALARGVQMRFRLIQADDARALVEVVDERERIHRPQSARLVAQVALFAVLAQLQAQAGERRGRVARGGHEDEVVLLVVSR